LLYLSVQGACDKESHGRKIALNVWLSRDLDADLTTISRDSGGSRSAVLRQALALVVVAHAAKRSDRHLGLVDDPARLETEIVGIL
jgi:hypothetical protein